MQVFIQTYFNEHTGNTDFAEDNGYYAYRGFDLKRNYQIKFFEDIMEVPLNNLVVASISDTRQYFLRSGIRCPVPLNIPSELEKYLGRNIQVKTFAEFKKEPIPEKGIFVKSFAEIKLIRSGVIKEEKAKEDENTFGCPDDTLLLVSEVIDIISEYRVFVNRGKIIGIKHYQGDFRVFPDISFIEEAVEDYKNAPVSFTLDFGVTTDKKTWLIEANDAWSIGPYGLDFELYARFLLDRWIEIFRR